MSLTKYQDPLQTATGKLFGKKSKISQRKLFGIYESTYCYINKPNHWSDAQMLHRNKMGAASLYAKLLLQDPDFEKQVTQLRLDRTRRAMNPRSEADKQIKPYIRNQQMLTSLLYNRLSTTDSSASPDASSDIPLVNQILNGYTRYCACPITNRPAVLAQLSAELSANLESFKSLLLQ